jgi:hypothetical protein
VAGELLEEGAAGGVGEGAEDGVGVGLLHAKTITGWLFVVNVKFPASSDARVPIGRAGRC